MSNTYTQIHIQAVFAISNRESLIQQDWKNELYGYITGIIENHTHKVLAINGMPDHIHLFFGFRPTQSLSELMRIVKGDSSEWVNMNKLTKNRFSWQNGYGAFSYSKSHVENVIRYIKDQEKHHAVKSFKKEYKEHLDKFGIEYDDRFLFKPID